MKYIFRYVFGPLFLMITTPITAFIFWFVAAKCNGSILMFWNIVQQEGVWPTIYHIIAPVFWGSKFSWTVILCYICYEIILMRFIPGKKYFGPKTAQGNLPEYKENGLWCYLITLATFFSLYYLLPSFKPGLLFIHLGEFIGSMNLFSFVFCLFLYFKGRFFPSSSDHSMTKNPIFDFYWGTELYPRVFGFDLKQWTNCRFGMMGWPLIILSYLIYQMETSHLTNAMVVSVALQIVYITKFFIWEKGYMRSIDIMHDRAGYYICWGCLVWVPVVYTSVPLFLINIPETLHFYAAASCFVLGTIAILGNFWCDYDRMRYREQYRNQKKLVGVTYMEATSKLGHDCGNKYPLITSGLWGVSRNFRYVLEILGAFFWTLPAGFFLILPWFYCVFLMMLLFDRANRNDVRCHERYLEDWDIYCKKVPYKIIPGIY